MHMFLSYNSGGHKSEVSFTGLNKVKTLPGLVPSAGSRGESVSVPFLASRGHLHPLV